MSSEGHLVALTKPLLEQGHYVSTSSWKYPGWKSLVYRKPYASQKAFAAGCLAEYAETFPTVGVDATFYAWPSRRTLADWAAQTPAHFRFGFKVTEDATVKRWPKHARYGARAGKDNTAFLDAEAVKAKFLAPLEPLGDKVGPLMFEFGTFAKSDVADAAAFAGMLDGFLARLPKGPAYAVEIRNRTFLTPDYFGCLARHGVAHVYNSWTRMPAIGEQLRLPGSVTSGTLVVRALLVPGTTYEGAVEAFQPYDRIQAPSPQLRQDVADVIATARERKARAFIFVNNRAEGCAPLTIAAIAAQAGVAVPTDAPTPGIDFRTGAGVD